MRVSRAGTFIVIGGGPQRVHTQGGKQGDRQGHSGPRSVVRIHTEVGGTVGKTVGPTVTTAAMRRWELHEVTLFMIRQLEDKQCRLEDVLALVQVTPQQQEHPSM